MGEPLELFAYTGTERKRNDRIVIEFVLTGVTSALELGASNEFN